MCVDAWFSRFIEKNSHNYDVGLYPIPQPDLQHKSLTRQLAVTSDRIKLTSTREDVKYIWALGFSAGVILEKLWVLFWQSIAGTVLLPCLFQAIALLSSFSLSFLLHLNLPSILCWLSSYSSQYSSAQSLCSSLAIPNLSPRLLLSLTVFP